MASLPTFLCKWPRSSKSLNCREFYAAFLLALQAGLRRGEILGLRWQDVDFVNETVKVDIRFHDQRHTSATLMVEAGTDIKVVSNQLRHAHISDGRHMRWPHPHTSTARRTGG
jgi:integrase